MTTRFVYFKNAITQKKVYTIHANTRAELIKEIFQQKIFENNGYMNDLFKSARIISDDHFIDTTIPPSAINIYIWFRY